MKFSVGLLYRELSIERENASLLTRLTSIQLYVSTPIAIIRQIVYQCTTRRLSRHLSKQSRP